MQVNVTSYSQTDLPLHTTFYYRVAAHNYLGDSAWSNESSVDTWAYGDFDGDNDVDQEDFGQLQECMSGTGIPQNDPAYQDARLDEGDDVDLDDFAIFYACMSGANNPPTPGCAD